MNISHYVHIISRGEHIIRKEASLNCIREYIMINPLGRDLDEENPHQKGDDEFYKWFKRQFIKGESNP